MRILVGKTFGIGNACLSVPMVKALATMGEVDVLVGSSPDDYGSFHVFDHLRDLGYVQRIYVNDSTVDEYDVAVMAIPFDGRWTNGVHYNARRVIDGRKRPDNVDRLGFDMWKRHEAEYQMDDARELGYEGTMPDGSFINMDGLADPDCCIEQDPDLVYLGIGYKRDPGGFGLSKHIGNSNLVGFIRGVRSIRPSVRFVSTGGLRDLQEVGVPVMREVGGHPTYTCHVDSMDSSFRRLAGCRAYFGNDTGMMHVAASLSLPTYGVTPYSDLLVKNPPLCRRSRMVVHSGDVPTPRMLAEDFVEFVWRQ